MQSPPTPPSNLQAALIYAQRLNWRVFPVRPDKRPFTPHGLYDATTDTDTITRWWTQWPHAAIGVNCGASGIVALDVDAGKGGFDALELLTAEHGELPATAVSVTGGGGRHYLFKHPGESVRNSVSTLGTGLDIRGDGGYIILPPSRHASGNLYAWDTPPHTTPPAELPDWLRTAILTRRSPTASASGGNPLASSEPIADGGRNDTLFRCASILRAQGMEYEDILNTIAAVNIARCKPPLPDAELQTIARSVTRYEAGPPLTEPWDDSNPDTAIRSGGLPLRPRGVTVPDETDLGNAQRFAEQHGEDVRYVKAWNRWLLWTGTHWRTSDTAEAERLAHATAESINDEIRLLSTELSTLTVQLQADTQRQAAALADGSGANLDALSATRRRTQYLEDKIKHLAKHAHDSKSDRSLRAMLRLAGQLSGIDTPSGDLDRDPFLLNVANGTLDLRTGALRAHDRADLLTRCAPVTYDATAVCPRWQAFLTEIMQGDTDLVSYLQRAVGYSLTGSVSAQVLFFMHGDGRNGKSTFINVVRSLLGGYASIGASTLLDDSTNNHPTELADLCSRRVVIISETEDGKPLPQAQIKRLTSEEPLKARRMREDFWEFTPTHKLWIAGNHKPTVRGGDLGIWRRLQLIPFKYTIPLDRVDANLPTALASELPGILAWAIQGCLEYLSRGLRPPEAVVTATEEYREDEDVVGGFLSDCCIREPDAFISGLQLFQAYVTWAEQCGFRPLDIKRFKRRLESAGFAHRRTEYARGYSGLRLTPSGVRAVT